MKITKCFPLIILRKRLHFCQASPFIFGRQYFFKALELRPWSFFLFTAIGSNPAICTISSIMHVRWTSTLKEAGVSKSVRWIRIRLVFHQFSSKLFFWSKLFDVSFYHFFFFFEKLRIIEIGPRGRWKRSSILHPSQKSMLSKALSL